MTARDPQERRAEAIRRLQVGGTGLALVALLVGLSTLLTSEAREGVQSAQPQTSAGNAAPLPADGATPADPLTDLGVEPAANDPAAPARTPPGVGNAPPVGPVVPDLQPDPDLRRAPPQQ